MKSMTRERVYDILKWRRCSNPTNTTVWFYCLLTGWYYMSAVRQMNFSVDYSKKDWITKTKHQCWCCCCCCCCRRIDETSYFPRELLRRGSEPRCCHYYGCWLPLRPLPQRKMGCSVVGFKGSNPRIWGRGWTIGLRSRSVGCPLTLFESDKEIRRTKCK